MKPARYHAGFTLIELVIVIVLTAIMAGAVSVFIATPMRGYTDLTRRAQLVDAAESALRLMARDIRRALPNSVRCNNNCNGATALELLATHDGARYRADPPGSAADRLRFNNADVEFDTVGPFINTTKPFDSAGHRLAIYNLGAPGANAYAGDAVITPAGVTFRITAESAGVDHVTLSAGHQFAYESPRQKLFIVEGPVSYICTGDRLLRYDGYAIADPQPIPPGVDGIPVTAHVSACRFDYVPGTATRAGLVTLSLTLTEAGESVRLLHQIHVDNTP